MRGLRPARPRLRAGAGTCARLTRPIVALATIIALGAAGASSAGSVASSGRPEGVASSASSSVIASAAPDLAAAAHNILGAGQGVYVEAADGTVLVAQAAAHPVHPASVSKVPSTLALLSKLGPDYRFETRFTWSGSIVDGALQGDLTVRSHGDASLVDEDALLIAARLNELGIHSIAGTLRLSGLVIFNWKPDLDGLRLREALAGQAPDAASQAVSEVERGGGAVGAGLGRPAVSFGRARCCEARIAPAALEAPRVLAAPQLGPASHVLVYRSQPLISLLKSLNDYSNNVFDSLVDAIGGAPAVEVLARSRVPADLRDEIILGDAAGEDARNRLSPRAAVRLLRELERELATTGHSLSDVLPVAGVDSGTLEARLDHPNEAGRVVGKTGTYGSYGASALIGAIRTHDRGTVYFAILDHGVPVPEARRRQDRFVRALFARFGTTPWPYHPDGLSAVARAQIVVREPPPADQPQSVSPSKAVLSH